MKRANSIAGFSLRSKTGFSLTELMVVFVIIGVLATVAIPRYNIFVARSRQAEAKNNLGTIFKLQETYKLQHGTYDTADAVTGITNSAMNTSAASSGYISESATSDATRNICGRNSLGFRVANCGEARYRYYIAVADEDEFLAIAAAYSDHTTDATVRNDKRIFPGCNGNDGAIKRNPGQGILEQGGANGWKAMPSGNGAGQTQTVLTAATVNSAAEFDKGDAWFLDQRRELVNYRDIVNFCDK